MKFNKISKKYKTLPFWIWNDRIDIKAVRKEILEMHKKGIGGFFIHSRLGLITPYLGSQWMRCVQEAVKLAGTLGMEAWLYDEDRWPSGFAGGEVSKDPKNAIKQIQYLPNKKIAKIADSPKHYWFNNTQYIDVFDAKVVKKFIKSTHEKYKKIVGREFGKTIPGIFTDEPNCSPGQFDNGMKVVPWSDTVPDKFQKTYGYDIRDKLIKLFENNGDYFKVRYDFYKLINCMFAEGFFKTIYDWCEKNKLESTGHALKEDTFTDQIVANGGSVMTLYQYMQRPGIDYLRQKSLIKLMTLKQVSSVARQTGRKRVLCEIFGGGGWDTTMSQVKKIADWNFIHGVNCINQHMFLSSCRGIRKRDWPPSYFYQNPVWEKYEQMSNYLSRMSQVLCRFAVQKEIAVLHPIESAYGLFTPVNGKRSETMFAKYDQILYSLADHGYDYDLIDEGILSKFAKVSKQKLCFDKASYSILIIPALLTIRSSTLHILENFAVNGEIIISIGQLPSRLDGRRNKSVKQRIKKISMEIPGKQNQTGLLKKLRKLLPKNPVARGSHTPLHIRHGISGSMHLFMVLAASETKEFKGELILPVTGKIEQVDFWHNKVEKISCKQQNGRTSVPLTLRPLESCIIVVDTSKKYVPVKNRISRKVKIVLSVPWQIKFNAPNVLPIYESKIKIGKRGWSSAMLAGSKWPLDSCQELAEKKAQDGEFIKLKYSFHIIDCSKIGRIELTMEQQEIYEIKINGKKYGFKDCGWFQDRNIRRTDISRSLVDGNNTIELSTRFFNPKKKKTLIFVKNGVEIETLHLLGNFNADTEKATISPFPLKNDCPLGDVVSKGYPYYSGSVTYSCEFRNLSKGKGRTYIEFREAHCSLLNVEVNGKDAGSAIESPYRIEISRLLKRGKNQLNINLYSTPYNLWEGNQREFKKFGMIKEPLLMVEK